MLSVKVWYSCQMLNYMLLQANLNTMQACVQCLTTNNGVNLNTCDSVPGSLSLTKGPSLLNRKGTTNNDLGMISKLYK